MSSPTVGWGRTTFWSRPRECPGAEAQRGRLSPRRPRCRAERLRPRFLLSRCPLHRGIPLFEFQPALLASWSVFWRYVPPASITSGLHQVEAAVVEGGNESIDVARWQGCLDRLPVPAHDARLFLTHARGERG